MKRRTTDEHGTPDHRPDLDPELDLRPGGVFRSVMRSPEEEEFPNIGCCLEVVENRRLTFTDALGPAFPTENPFFTAIVTMEPEGAGTRTSPAPSTAPPPTGRSTRR